MPADPIKEDEGIKVNTKVAKNRFAKGNPFRSCEYFAMFGIGIDTIIEIPDILERESLIRRAGSWYYFEDSSGKPKVINGTEMKFKSKSAFVDWLRLDAKGKAFFDNVIQMADLKGKALASIEIAEIEKENEDIEEEMKIIDNELIQEEANV